MSLPQPTTRRGFTLTELLVVIAIIAILASLAGAGIMAAMNRARATAIKVELDQIDSAMKRYKDTYGSYPPCNLAFLETAGGVTAAERTRRRQVVKQHLAMAFPRYNASAIDPSNSLEKLENDLTQAGVDLYHIRPDQALVFWLQGFSADPTNPILSINDKQVVNNSEVGNAQKRTNNFFEFDQERLVGREIGGGSAYNVAPSYFPSGARIATSTDPLKRYPVWDSGAPPIVYFDSRFYEFAAPVYVGTEARPNQFNTSAVSIFPDAGVAVPYWHDRNGNGSSSQTDDQNSQETWANPDSYQLIAAGMDGKYGVATPSSNAKMYPTGTLYDITGGTDDDNATNFTASTRLGDDLP